MEKFTQTLKTIYDIEAVKDDIIIQERLKELGWIKAPVIDYIKIDCHDPRENYQTRINGHIVDIHCQEESAQNYVEQLKTYINITNF